MNSFKAIIHAMRPATLLTGAAPVLLGASVGYMSNPSDENHPQLLILVVSILAVVVMQAAANLVNDAKDAENGIDDENRTGPVRVVQSGILSLKTVKLAYKSCFALSFMLALIISYYGGWSILVTALVSALFAYAYTGGPYPLAYYAMGEITAFLFFGLVAVAFSAFLQAKSWSIDFWLWGIGPGLISAAIMAINNYRDIDTDRKNGKHTLATILGSRWAKYLPLTFSATALIIPFLIRSDFRDNLWALSVSIFLLIFLLFKLRPLIDSNAADLNKALRMTAIVNLLFCLFFATIVYNN